MFFTGVFNVDLRFAKHVVVFLKICVSSRRNGPFISLAFFLMIFNVSTFFFPAFYREMEATKKQFSTSVLGSEGPKSIHVSRNGALQKQGKPNGDRQSGNGASDLTF
jgi:hypothetical protein